MVKYLGTAVFGLWFLLTAPVCTVLGALLWLVTLPFDKNHALLHAFVCRWCHLVYLRAWPGWRVSVEGRELLPPGPAVLISNHQSAMDIVTAMGLFHPFKFVAKSSLFNVPMVGWMMTLMEYVPVERGHPHAMEKMLEDSRRWLRRGVAVFVFPEGTYAPVDQRLPFKRGAFRLAIEEKVPVVPVMLEGTTDIIEGDGPRMHAWATVRVRVLPPLPVESLGDDETVLAARVRALYFEALGLPLPPEEQALEKNQQCA